MPQAAEGWAISFLKAEQAGAAPSIPDVDGREVLKGANPQGRGATRMLPPPNEQRHQCHESH